MNKHYNFLESDCASIDHSGVRHIREKYGYEGYGIYIALLKIMPSYGYQIGLPDIGYIAMDLGVCKSWLTNFLYYAACCNPCEPILHFDGFYYTSPCVKKTTDKEKYITYVRRKAAQVRWDKNKGGHQ
jgi:hypothetical protein